MKMSLPVSEPDYNGAAYTKEVLINAFCVGISKRLEVNIIYQNCCKKCGSISLHTEVKGNNTGLYCDDCGAWIKWLSKDELRAFNHSLQESMNNHTKFINKLNEAGEEIRYGRSIETRLKEFVEFLNKKINSEYEKLPISHEDAIRKNSYCFALQQDIFALENILNGKDWNYKE